MRLELRVHPITEIRFGDVTGLDGPSLVVDNAALIAYLLEDQRLIDVAVEIAPPGFPCRIGAVFDILEPRAKESGTGSDFPGLLGRMGVSGQGVTNVLSAAAVMVIDPIITPGTNTKMLEMHGEPAGATPYGGLWHLVIVPRASEDILDHSVRGALRAASVKTSVYLGQAGIG